MSSKQEPSADAEVQMSRAAKWLRQAAETAASASRDWDNFEAICKRIIEAAFKAGKSVS